MKTKYSNSMVYEFLVKECQSLPELEEEFVTKLKTHNCDADFFDRLSEELDCFRICNECGKPMIEGFVVEGCNTYCSEECLHMHISEEDFNSLCDNGNGDTYWTTWYEDSNTYSRN